MRAQRNMLRPIFFKWRFSCGEIRFARIFYRMKGGTRFYEVIGQKHR